jgi:nucleotide-binding universal stress UspA family protein
MARLSQVSPSTAAWSDHAVGMKTLLNPPRAKRLPSSSKAIQARGVRITRIIVPIDFSRMSLKAIPYALSVAQQFRADVHLLHVVDEGRYLSPPSLSLAAAMRDQWKDRLMTRLTKLAVRYKADGQVHVLRPREGTAYKEICAAAESVNADLIVIATHGYTGVRRAALGSTAERVVQHSSCPVLVVRHYAHHRNGMNGQRTLTGFRLWRILVPTDFSESAKRGFRYAIKLASEFEAEIRLVHVINSHAYQFADEFAGLGPTQLINRASHLARKKMREMGAKTKCRYSFKIAHGLPASEICEAANRDTDLIVTSTHGRTGIGHVLIGSVAEHIVRYARCPVLVIPPARNSINQNNHR